MSNTQMINWISKPINGNFPQNHMARLWRLILNERNLSITIHGLISRSMSITRGSDEYTEVQRSKSRGNIYKEIRSEGITWKKLVEFLFISVGICEEFEFVITVYKPNGVMNEYYITGDRKYYYHNSNPGYRLSELWGMVYKGETDMSPDKLAAQLLKKWESQGYKPDVGMSQIVTNLSPRYMTWKQFYRNLTMYLEISKFSMGAVLKSPIPKQTTQHVIVLGVLPEDMEKMNNDEHS